MNESDSDETGEEFEKASECFACGTVIAAVDEQTHKQMLASHVLDEHREQANAQLINECEEVLGR